MAKKLLALAFAICLQWSTGASLPAQTGVETRSVPVKRGDTLVINNDHGSIRIRSAQITTMEVKIWRKTRSTMQASSLKVDFQRNSDTISFRSFFTGFPGEAVDFDIKAPEFMNVKIAGANPNIDIGGIHGYVRIENRAGMVLAEDLTSSVSLLTEKGDVIYRANLQPEGDVRIESTFTFREYPPGGAEGCWTPPVAPGARAASPGKPEKDEREEIVSEFLWKSTFKGPACIVLRIFLEIFASIVVLGAERIRMSP
jgi:hypothetical protein